MIELRRALLSYYRSEARDLPWRGTRDPYRIWVSEIMLQQTQVATVAERYVRFLRRFPDLATLSQASVDQVCEEWAGLGYYSRAKNLHRAARTLTEDYAGQMPDEAQALQALPGIGRYTAGAIASIAFDQPVAAVDGNAERVLSRVFAIDEEGAAARSRLTWSLAEELADSPHPGQVNQALMDVAAAFCRPSAPLCPDCPLAKQCRAQQLGEPERYPPKKARVPRTRLDVAMVWIERPSHGDLLLEQRAARGLWAGQWQLPAEEGDGALERLVQRLDCSVTEPVVQVRHLLTHREVHGSVYIPAKFFGELADRMKWEAAPRSAPVNALSRKVIDLMLQ